MLLPDADALTSNAIDALERMIAGAYAPGKGMTRAVGGGLRVRGTAGDQVRAASALLIRAVAAPTSLRARSS